MATIMQIDNAMPVRAVQHTAYPHIPILSSSHSLPCIDQSLSYSYGLPDMEPGHILWPSDPGIQRPGDPVDPMTLFYNELLGVCESSTLSSILSSTRQGKWVSKSIYIRIWNVRFAFWAFFENRKNSGLTPGKNDHPVTRWPGRERWPKWPIDPVTHWPSSVSALYDKRNGDWRTSCICLQQE